MKGLEKFDRKPLLFKRQMWERDGCRAWDWASVGTWGHSVEILASAFLRRGLKGRQRCQGAEAFEAVEIWRRRARREKSRTWGLEDTST